MCEVNLMKVLCVTVKLLTIFNNTNSKVCQINYFKNKFCSMTCIRSLMCEVILVKVQCVTVKLLILFHNK